MLATNLQGTNIFVINSSSQTLSKINTETSQVNNTFALLGLAPNLMEIQDHFGYVVNSGANNVQKIDLLTGQTIATIFVAASSNPYDIAIKDNFAYVTGLFTNKLYKVSLTTNQVVAEVLVGIGPEGMCIAGNTLYVANTGNYPNYSPSTVSVIDLNTFAVAASIPVEMNAQFLAVADGKIHVVCTGNWSSVHGNICIIDPITNTVERTLPIGGNLGNIWIGANHKAYIAEAMNTGVYVYETRTFEMLNTSSNPFTPGGSCLSGNTDCLGIVNSHWGENGVVSLVNWNSEIIHDYTVGLAPTDIQFYSESTPVSDETASPVIKLSAYPNPFAEQVHFSLQQDGRTINKGTIEIFNIHGQLVRSMSLPEATWNGTDLNGTICPNGIYLFKYMNDRYETAVGKITLLK